MNTSSSLRQPAPLDETVLQYLCAFSKSDAIMNTVPFSCGNFRAEMMSILALPELRRELLQSLSNDFATPDGSQPSIELQGVNEIWVRALLFYLETEFSVTANTLSTPLAHSNTVSRLSVKRLSESDKALLDRKLQNFKTLSKNALRENTSILLFFLYQCLYLLNDFFSILSALPEGTRSASSQFSSVQFGIIKIEEASILRSTLPLLSLVTNPWPTSNLGAFLKNVIVSRNFSKLMRRLAASCLNVTSSDPLMVDFSLVTSSTTTVSASDREFFCATMASFVSTQIPDVNEERMPKYLLEEFLKSVLLLIEGKDSPFLDQLKKYKLQCEIEKSCKQFLLTSSTSPEQQQISSVSKKEENLVEKPGQPFSHIVLTEDCSSAKRKLLEEEVDNVDAVGGESDIDVHEELERGDVDEKEGKEQPPLELVNMPNEHITERPNTMAKYVFGPRQCILSFDVDRYSDASDSLLRAFSESLYISEAAFFLQASLLRILHTLQIALRKIEMLPHDHILYQALAQKRLAGDLPYAAVQSVFWRLAKMLTSVIERAPLPNKKTGHVLAVDPEKSFDELLTAIHTAHKSLRGVSEEILKLFLELKSSTKGSEHHKAYQELKTFTNRKPRKSSLTAEQVQFAYSSEDSIVDETSLKKFLYHSLMQIVHVLEGATCNVKRGMKEKEEALQIAAESARVALLVEECDDVYYERLMILQNFCEKNAVPEKVLESALLEMGDQLMHMDSDTFDALKLRLINSLSSLE